MAILPEEIIKEAKIALDDIKKQNFNRAISLVEAIIGSNEINLRQALAQLQADYTKEEMVLLLDIVKEERNIRKYAQEAYKGIKAGKARKARRLLKKIISLEKNVIGEKEKRRSYREEAKLGGKVAVEAAVALYLRNTIDPYAQALGREIDHIYYQLGRLKNAMEEMGEALKSAAGNLTDATLDGINFILKKLGYEEIQIEKSKKQTKKDVSEVAGKDKGFQALTYEPSYWPTYDSNAPFQVQFSQILWIAIVAVLGVAFILNTKKYIKNKLEQRRINRVVVSLSSIYNERIKSIVVQLNEERKKAQEMAANVSRLNLTIEQIILGLRGNKNLGKERILAIEMALRESDGVKRDAQVFAVESAERLRSTVEQLAAEIKGSAGNM